MNMRHYGRSVHYAVLRRRKSLSVVFCSIDCRDPDTRRTATEPLFDLIAQLIGAGDQQKQLPVQGLAKVRTCLALGTLMAQLAMIVNSIWGMPLHNISHMMTVFT